MLSQLNGTSRMLLAAVVLLVLVFSAMGYVFLDSSAPISSMSSSSSTSSQSSISNNATTLLPLITFNADAYTAEVQALLSGFTTTSGIAVAPTHSAGSFALAKQIASGSQVDVFIPVALSAAAPSNLGSLSSNWAIGFASDQMVIAYSNATRSTPMGRGVMSGFEGAAKSNATSDWSSAFASLASGMVKVVISDPTADP